MFSKKFYCSMIFKILEKWNKNAEPLEQNKGARVKTKNNYDFGERTILVIWRGQ